MSKQFVKVPNAYLDYKWDWSAWLGEGETIRAVLVTAETGLVLDTYINDTTTVTAWVSGGTADTEYDLTCKITTSEDRIDERTIKIYVQAQR